MLHDVTRGALRNEGDALLGPAQDQGEREPDLDVVLPAAGTRFVAHLPRVDAEPRLLAPEEADASPVAERF